MLSYLIAVAATATPEHTSSFLSFGSAIGVIGLLALAAAGYVVIRSSSSEKLAELRKDIEDAQDEKIKLQDAKIAELKSKWESCEARHTDLQGKYEVLQEQVTGSDTIIKVAQLLQQQYREQHGEQMSVLKEIRKAVGTRRADPPTTRRRSGA